MMPVGDGSLFPRIRGQGFFNDPNDLCQLLVALIPGVFIFWRSGKTFRNVLLVLLPVSALFYGMYLTHSRGGMIGLMVMLILLGKRKFGILPAAVTGGGLFVAMSAIGWSGGRDVSVGSGADRMEAWSVGLSLLRTHPIFGVGYKRFTEYFHITAHNTVVVCAAELGIVGFFFWTLLVVPTMYETSMVASVPRPSAEEDESGKRRGAPAARQRVPARSFSMKLSAARRPQLQLAFAAADGTTTGGVSAPARTSVASTALRTSSSLGLKATEVVSEQEIRRLCTLFMIGLSGFFTAGWFLSRSYTMALFVNIALAVAAHRMAVERGVSPSFLKPAKALKYAGIASVSLIAIVYAILRASNLVPK